MLKKMKLASKLALVIGVCLAVIFAILIFVTVAMSSQAITQSISGELTALADSNGLQVQQIFDSASTTANDIQKYMEKSYRIAEEDPGELVLPTAPETIEMCRSVIYPQILSPLTYDMEQYISETARNAAVTNADIVGVGAMFEPYKFQSNMRNYAFYVNADNATGTIEPFGNYETYSNEEYYQIAASSKQSVVTDPFDYEGIKMVSFAIPILYNNDLKGVVMSDINVTNFSKVNSSSETYPSMFAAILDDNGIIIYDSRDITNVGSSFIDSLTNQSEQDAVSANMKTGAEFQVTFTWNGKKNIMFMAPVQAGSETWWSMTALESSDMNEAVSTTVLWLVVLSVLALILILGVTMAVLRSMLKPLHPVVEAAEHISRGDLNISLSSEQQDEIGALSRTFMTMAQNLKTMVEDVDYLLSNMADGNFNIRTKAEESYTGDFKGFLLSMRKLNTKLSDTLGQINLSSEQVSSGSDQVSSGAQALSQGATEQASSVEELAATINEISVQVKGNAESAQLARKTVEDVGLKLTESDEQMQEMTKAMNEISEASGQIGKIIKTIEDIAFQTNILALNAAVEAARAGAAGKGFAVVADEVRNLASKSSEASKSTSELIERSLQAVENGTKIAAHTAESLLNVVDGTKEITEQISQIAQASNEQATSIAQITQGIDQISSVVQTNSATAEQSAAASEELTGQAQMLKNLVGQFKLKSTGGAEQTGPLAVQQTQAPQDSFISSDKY